jgi:GR25 family glycosyltransferase involved in LPS biosynthesis
MLDQLAAQFFANPEEAAAVNLIRAARSQELYKLGSILGEFFEKTFPHSVDIREEYALNAYYSDAYEESYDVFDRILQMKGLTEETAKRILFSQHFCIKKIALRNAYYNRDIVKQITSRKNVDSFPQVTFTITSCKRFNLFEKTIDSFLNCCTDLEKISRWICVDDNSSQEDIARMHERYPFFEFVLKQPEQKGHPQSMNMIRQLVKTPYVFHMEDDWLFFCKRPYISEAMDVISSNPKIMQCLVNKNYTETAEDINIKGGEFHTSSNGTRFYIHEMAYGDHETELWLQKHGRIGRHCNYWPHFSFRPSLFSTRVFKELGLFSENISHFEMDYSKRYINKGWVSAFFEGTYCLHIGRLTSERDDKTKTNAYELNNEAQFSGKEEQISEKEAVKRSVPEVTLEELGVKMRTFVVNLDRRPDRWAEFQDKGKLLSFLNYERHQAVDGAKLTSTDQLQRIFDGNDYRMRRGMVGCAMSHIQLCIQLVQSDDEAYCILEDDLDFTYDFDRKLKCVFQELELFPNWDMVYLGHHLHLQYITDELYNKSEMPRLEKWDRHTSLKQSMGGTGGYIISKKGARKLLNFINRTGMTNGIDTVQQKSADELNIFYAMPHLIYSECFRGDNSKDTDSDIQYDYDSLTVPVKTRIDNEILHHGSVTVLESIEDAEKAVRDCEYKDIAYYEDEDPCNIASLQRVCVHPCYTLDDTVLFVVPGGDTSRYFSRLDKDGKFDVSDAIVYKD